MKRFLAVLIFKLLAMEFFSNCLSEPLLNAS